MYLSDTREIKAAMRFFKHCETMLDEVPEQITTDKEPALYTAIKNSFCSQTKHRDSKYMNNNIEQSHRTIKSGIRPMKGFQDPWCAMICCTVFEAISQFFSARSKTLAQRRKLFASKLNDYLATA